MSELFDEKYNIASSLKAIDVFTLDDLRKKLQVEQLPLAAYAAIDDLLVSKYMEVSEDETPVFNPETYKLDTKVVLTYRIVPEKQKELEHYIEKLNKQRFQPDSQGKLQTLNYRIVEQLMEKLTAHPETLAQEERTIAHYFALLQEDEMSEQQTDPRQREISEAYIRSLYGRFMNIKSLWKEALLQLLIASLLFNKYKLEELRLATEQQACEIFEYWYEQVQKSDNIDQFSVFTQVIKNIEIIIPHNKNQLIVFFSLAELTLKEVTEISYKKQAVLLSNKRADLSAEMLSRVSRQLSRDKNYAKESNITVEKKRGRSLLEIIRNNKNILLSVRKFFPSESEEGFDQEEVLELFRSTS